MEHKKIVVIEKDKILKSILELFIEQLDYEVSASFLSFKDSINFIKSNTVHTLIIDLNAFDNRVSLKDYIHLIESLHFPIIFIGNSDDIDFAKEMIGFNVYSFMSKPVTKNILKINIAIAILKHNKILESKQETNTEQYACSCKTDSEGKIIDSDSSFTEIFKLHKNELKGLFLKDIFIDNQEFVDFNKFSSKIKSNEVKHSIFIFSNQVFESKITKKSNHIYSIFFKISRTDTTIFYKYHQRSAQFDTLFNNSSEAVLIFNSQNELVEYNDIAKSRYQTINKSELHKGISFFEILNFIPNHELQNILETIRIPAVHLLTRTISNDERDFVLKIKIAPIITDKIKSIGGFIISSVEQSKEIQLLEEINTLKNEIKPIYESSIQRFYITDKNKRIITFNQAALKIIQEEFNHTLQKGDNILQFIPKEISEEEFNSHFEKVLKGEVISFKIKVESTLGTYWNKVKYEPIIDENGELSRVLFWTLDITESEQNLIALNKSNERYELIAKSGNDGLWDWDLRNNDVYLSPRWKNLLGYEDDEIENEFGVRDALTHPDDRISSENILTEYLNSDSDSFQNEIRLLCKDKSYKWVLERGIILRDSEQKVYRIAGSITDITEQKESEKILLNLNRSLLEERAMFIRGNVGIIRVDALDVTRVTYVSNNTKYIIGYSPQEFYNNKVPFKDIIHPDDKKSHLKERNDAIKNNQSHIDFTDYRLIKKDGGIIWVKDFTSIIRNEKGEVRSLLGYIIDITKEKFIEAEYENMQNMYSSIWHSLDTETFIVFNSGEIIFSRNHQKYSIRDLIDKTLFIYNEFKSLTEWKKIYTSIQSDTAEYNSKEIINGKEYKIKIHKIDSKRLLISSNIKITK